jgi:hypothetical protein
MASAILASQYASHKTVQIKLAHRNGQISVPFNANVAHWNLKAGLQTNVLFTPKSNTGNKHGYNRLAASHKEAAFSQSSQRYTIKYFHTVNV